MTGAILREIRANSIRWRECKSHRFERPEQIIFGAKHRCVNCGGEQRLSYITMYLDSYRAAGGDPNDIWPGWCAPVVSDENGEV